MNKLIICFVIYILSISSSIFAYTSSKSRFFPDTQRYYAGMLLNGAVHNSGPVEFQGTYGGYDDGSDKVNIVRAKEGYSPTATQCGAIFGYYLNKFCVLEFRGVYTHDMKLVNFNKGFASFYEKDTFLSDESESLVSKFVNIDLLLRSGNLLTWNMFSLHGGVKISYIQMWDAHMIPDYSYMSRLADLGEIKNIAYGFGAGGVIGFDCVLSNNISIGMNFDLSYYPTIVEMSSKVFDGLGKTRVSDFSTSSEDHLSKLLRKGLGIVTSVGISLKYRF